jgi:hypothetical protein
MGKHEEHGGQGGPEALVEHLKECRQVDAAIVADGNADELVASLIEQGWTYEGVEYVEGKRVRYLVPPPGVLLVHEEPEPPAVGPWPSELDGLPVSPEDPPGYHVREKTEGGYPLMGSSPAEREEARQRAARIQRQAMRDHPFVGEGAYCEARITTRTQGSAETGYVSGWVGCGYGRDTHPTPGTEDPTP